MKVSHFLMGGFAALLVFGFTNCKKDDSSSAVGKVRFEMTDGPIDDTNIQGVFVTVAAVKVDGSAIDGFTGKQTIDLSAYQNGQVKVLGEDSGLSAGTHRDVRLVLDYATDANGNSPGCYVLLKNGAKQTLQAGANATGEIKIDDALEVTADQTTAAVFDFDLRKSVIYSTGSSQYKFVTDNELASFIRLTTRTESGTISGNCSDPLHLAGSKIIVYAYTKGTYTSAEKQPQGPSGIKFKNAVSSAVVDGEGNFTLAFLQEGDYELHFVGYDDSNGDGKMEEKGFLALDIVGGLNLDKLRVTANANLQLSLTVSALLPF